MRPEARGPTRRPQYRLTGEYLRALSEERVALAARKPREGPAGRPQGGPARLRGAGAGDGTPDGPDPSRHTGAFGGASLWKWQPGVAARDTPKEGFEGLRNLLARSTS